MTWADVRFRDLLALHCPDLPIADREEACREMCEMLRREWFVEPQSASFYAVMECWTEWVRRKGGIRKVQDGET